MYVEGYAETVLFVVQLYVVLAFQCYDILAVVGIVNRVGYLDVGDKCRRRFTLLQDLFGIEVTQSVDRSEVEVPVLSISYTSTAETTHRKVVVMVVVVERLFTLNEAANTLVRANPDIAGFIFANGMYMCIGKSAFPLIYFVCLVGKRRKAYQSFAGSYPQTFPAIFIDGVDGIRRKLILNIE